MTTPSLRTTSISWAGPLVLLCAASLSAQAPAPSDHAGLFESSESSAPMSRAELAAREPKSPNPYVSFLPAGVEPDYDYWDAELALRAAERPRRLPPLPRSGPISESEPNDSAATADALSPFGDPGTGVMILGTTDPLPLPTAGPVTAEENGSIGTATTVNPTSGNGVIISSTIGDGAHGSAGTGNGDFDFYEVTLQANEILTVETLAPGSLDTVALLYTANGFFLGASDNAFPFPNTNSQFRFTVLAGGTFYVAIGGSTTGPITPSDPSDPSSGPGAGSEGAYDLLIGRDYHTEDYFSVDLSAGDVVGFASDISVDLSILDGDGTVRHGSTRTTSGNAPAASTLPNGVIETNTVVGRDGLHTVRVRSISAVARDYELTGSVDRPLLETAGGPQVLFVDFDGASGINALSLYGQGESNATLSPLADFLLGWGLAPGDEDAVIDAILGSIEESLDDLEAVNSNVSFELRNSRDHADPFGQPRVSRLIVGGTIAELGISTIGIAQSIDTGNFEFEETGVILLDILSAPSPGPSTLNQFALAPGASKIDLVGAGVGNITAHEAGHYLGNWHTENSNSLGTIMDSGGNLAGTVGVGLDGTFGTADDVDVDFVVDVFAFVEGFRGSEDQRARTGLGESARFFADGFEGGDVLEWSSSSP